MLIILIVISVPVSLQWEQAVAGQKSVRMGLELEGAHGHYRALGEAWELELGLDQQAACDWGPHGEDSGKPEWGKEGCLVACRYCRGKCGRIMRLDKMK